MFGNLNNNLKIVFFGNPINHITWFICPQRQFGVPEKLCMRMTRVQQECGVFSIDFVQDCDDDENNSNDNDYDE